MKTRPNVRSGLASVVVTLSLTLALAANAQTAEQIKPPPPQLHTLKITVLSTMLVGEPAGIGEWGFSALVEGDGHRILVDTGSRPETVLQNVREMKIDLSDVPEVILTHNHGDHVGGLLTLRREFMKKNPAALSVAHVAKGIFYSRPSPRGEDNEMIAIRKEYEATGGKFIEHADAAEIFPGAWLSGPVPRKYPEHNWSVKGKVQTPRRPRGRHDSRGSVFRSQHIVGAGRRDRLRARWHREHSDLCNESIHRPACTCHRRRPSSVSCKERPSGLDRR